MASLAEVRSKLRRLKETVTKLRDVDEQMASGNLRWCHDQVKGMLKYGDD